MKYKLNVIERIALLEVLPKQGSYATQKVVSDLAQKVGLSAKDLEKMEYKQVGGKSKWNPNKEPKLELDLGKFETEVIVDALKEMDTKKTMEKRHLSLYERFVNVQ